VCVGEGVCECVCVCVCRVGRGCGSRYQRGEVVLGTIRSKRISLPVDGCHGSRLLLSVYQLIPHIVFSYIDSLRLSFIRDCRIQP